MKTADQLGEAIVTARLVASRDSWLDSTIRVGVEAGRRFDTRVRVVPEPLTPYLRFGLYHCAFNVDAGEDKLDSGMWIPHLYTDLRPRDELHPRTLTSNPSHLVDARGPTTDVVVGPRCGHHPHPDMTGRILECWAG